MSSKPQIKNLQKGIISCSGCGQKVQLFDYEPLEVINCSKCNIPIFIPMKIKDFWLYTPLGGGGMGSVYLAISEVHKGEFAIKVLPRNRKKDQDLISTLTLEGEVGIILGKAPNIAEVVDYGFEDDEYFLASRYVEGARLDLYISTSSHLSERQSIDIMLQVVAAEIHIINCGFLFRDMKPENIIVADKDAVVKLFDFGLTQSLEKAMHPDENDALEGSPFYLPPERIVAAPEGEHSEIYSLGMLFFQMLAGTTYFSESDIKDLLSKHVRSLRVASVASRLKHCSNEVVDLLDLMIKRSPNERLQSLEVLMVELEKLKDKASGYPLSSASEGGKKASKSSFSNKKSSGSKFIILAIFCFILLVAFGGWYFMALESEKTRKKELLISISQKIGVSPDIKSPTISKDGVKRAVEEKIQKIVNGQVANLPKFDIKEVEAKICKKLSLSVSMRKTPSLTVAQINKLVSKQVKLKTDNYLSKNSKRYNEVDAAKRVAGFMKVELPVSAPEMSLKSIKKEISKDAILASKEKYSSKDLSMKVMKIMKKYSVYKEGERVKVRDQAGLKISGLYGGRDGNKVIIGTRKVMLSDLPPNDRVKFNPSLSAKRASFEIKKLKENIAYKRKEFVKKYIASTGKKMYLKNGYTLVDKKLVPISEVFAKNISKDRAKFKSNQRLMRERVKRKMKKNFNKDKFIESYGYCKLKGKWYSEESIIDKLLKEERDVFNAKRNVKIKKIKNDIKDKIETEIYTENRYIKVDDNWEPAYEVLHKAYRKALQ